MHCNTKLCPTSLWLTWFDISPGKNTSCSFSSPQIHPNLCLLSVVLLVQLYSRIITCLYKSVYPPFTNLYRTGATGLHGAAAFLFNCNKTGAQLIVCLHLKAKQDLHQESSWDIRMTICQGNMTVADYPIYFHFKASPCHLLVHALAMSKIDHSLLFFYLLNGQSTNWERSQPGVSDERIYLIITVHWTLLSAL